MTDEKLLAYQDSPRSWLVAVACSWCFFWTMVINRCSGIVFLAMIHQFKTTRETASWPFSLMPAVSNIFGVATGVLVKLYGAKVVSIAGSLLCGFGVLLCAVFYDVTPIIVCLGVITALGQGMLFPANMVSINTHFKKYRTSANGIGYTGSTLVSFIFPPLLLVMFDNYGLRGTFLIVSALTLNSLAGSLLMWSPSQRTTKPNPAEKITSDSSLKRPFLDDNNSVVKLSTEETLFSKWSKHLDFFKRPIYYLIVISGIIYVYCLVVFNVIIVDFAVETGIGRSRAAGLLSYYGAGDLVGRVFSGMITDKKILQRRHMLLLSFTLIAIVFFTIPLATTYGGLAALNVLFGVASGSTIILFVVLIVEYIGMKNFPLALGFYSMALGIACIPRPLLIGYYKDRWNSYGSLFQLQAILSSAVVVAWTLESAISFWDKKRKEKAKDQNESIQDDL